MKTNNAAPLPSALSQIEVIISKIKETRAITFFDYDGTLSPIVSRPDLAILSDPMRQAVARLSTIMHIAVISGRELSDVKSMTRISNIYYGGSHGFELENPDGVKEDAKNSDEYLPFLDKAQNSLQMLFSACPGLVIERKMYAIAIHYRLVKDDCMIRSIEGILTNLINEFPQLKITSGKKIFELRPAVDWDKGKAILFIINKIFGNSRNLYPIYIGDDLTDEDAFKVIKGWGTGILVGDHGHPTYADFCLNDTEQVLQFITSINENLSSNI